MKLTHIALALSIAVCSMPVMAETLYIEGRILGSTCKVAVEGSNNFTVKLADTPAAVFIDFNAYFNPEPFNILVTDCKGISLNRVGAIFQDGPTVLDTGNLKNMEANGAGNVEIALFRRTADPSVINIKSGANNTAFVAAEVRLTPTSYRLPFAAAYKRSSATALPTPGIVKTSVEFLMSYN